MTSKALVSCQTCHETSVLPDDPAALAGVMTEFIDLHQRMQHWNFELVPVSLGADEPRRINASERKV
jgi:hypothetical protein